MISVRLPVEKRGFLEKYSPSMFAGWQRRYVIIKNRKLKYYTSDKEKDLKIPLGILNFDHLNCKVSKIDQNSNCFNVQIIGIENRIFQFRAATSEICS